MPMMPIEPAKAVMIVRPFFVIRFEKERERAVSGDIEERSSRPPASAGSASATSPGSKGSESPATRPSAMRTTRVA